MYLMVVKWERKRKKEGGIFDAQFCTKIKAQARGAKVKKPAPLNTIAMEEKNKAKELLGKKVWEELIEKFDLTKAK